MSGSGERPEPDVHRDAERPPEPDPAPSGEAIGDAGGEGPGGAVGAGARAIALEVEIGASPADVWRCLTEASELERWFPLHARVSPGEGGSIWVSWGAGVEAGSRIAIWEPERHLRMVGPEGAPVQLVVDFHLEGRGGSTVLRLVHSGFGEDEAWDDEYEGTRAGWGYFLLNLRHYLERHRGTARRMVWARRRVRGERERVLERLLGDGGLGVAAGPAAAFARGQAARLTGLGERALDARVLDHRPGRSFAAALPGLNDGLLFLEVEPGTAEVHAGVWISTYGVGADRVDELQRRLDARLSAFPDEV